MILTQSLSDNNIVRSTTPDGDVSTHGESTSYNTVNEERNCKQQPSVTKTKTPSKKMIHRTSSRDRGRPVRSDSSNLYELSSDIADKAVECLENKYGGKEKANSAAKTIQHYYRHFMLSKGFLRVRAYSGRRRSLTMPEKQFQLLKNKSLVFYGPDNPVMIVDCEFERNNVEPNSTLEESTEEAGDYEDDDNENTVEKPNIMALANEEGMRMCSQSTIDSDDNDDTLIGEVVTTTEKNDNVNVIEKSCDNNDEAFDNIDSNNKSDCDTVSLGDKVEVRFCSCLKFCHLQDCLLI